MSSGKSNTGENFSQKRMDRCMQIVRAIMTNWRETNSFQYVARATESVDGLAIDDLRKMYFTVGVGDQTRDIPFLDMLVVFDLIEQEHQFMQANADTKAERLQATFEIMTDYTDQEAVHLLSQMTIETPHDEKDFLKIRKIEI